MARPQAFDTENALQQATELFWKNGYERTSLSALLDQMRIQRSSFYNTFSDKSSLFAQVMQKYIRFANDDFIIATLNDHSSGLEAIQTVFTKLVDALASDTECKGCLMVNTQIELAPLDPQIRQMVEASEQRMHAALLDALRRAQAACEIRTDLDAEAAAHFLLMSITGLRVTGRSTHQRHIFEQIVKVVLSTLTC